jgi:hypothetical protein
MNSLCLTCRHSHIVYGQQDDPRIILCEAHAFRPINITFEVHECDRYHEVTRQSLRDMQEIAHILVVKKNKVVGFRSPKEKEDE